jgi:hypothetical protein
LLIDRNIQIHCCVDKHETIGSAQKSHKMLIKSGTIVRGIKTKYNGVNSVTKVARNKLFSHLHDYLRKMLFYINTNRQRIRITQYNSTTTRFSFHALNGNQIFRLIVSLKKLLTKKLTTNSHTGIFDSQLSNQTERLTIIQINKGMNMRVNNRNVKGGQSF